DVLGYAVPVIVDVDGVQHVIIEVIVIGRVGRVLAWIHIEDKGDAPISRSAREVARVVADKGIDIGVVGGRIHGDKWSFPVTCRFGGGAPCQSDRRQQGDDSLG